MIEPKFKPEGRYLPHCNSWIGGGVAWISAVDECWYVVLMAPVVIVTDDYAGKRWIVAGLDREAVAAAAQVFIDCGYADITPHVVAGSSAARSG